MVEMKGLLWLDSEESESRFHWEFPGNNYALSWWLGEDDFKTSFKERVEIVK